MWGTQNGWGAVGRCRPKSVAIGPLARYSAKNIDILVGDIFDMSAKYLGTVNAIDDRAALVALPADTRRKYAARTTSLTNAVPRLLISYDYNQMLMEGPPFSVNADELKQLFGTVYQLESVERKNVESGSKGKVAVTETAWLLQKASEQVRKNGFRA